jgi:Tol biopolymer transport system component/DNA-binding winged helix-turn-helix (wHTH) protein
MPVQARQVFRFADLEVHEHELRATRGGQALEIEPKAFRLLVYLIKHAGHLVSKSELIDAVWGETAVTDNSLTRLIALLRRVLEDDPRQPQFIETVSTAGYRFICPVVDEESSASSQVAGVLPITETIGSAPEAVGPEAKPRTWLRRRALIVGVPVVFLATALLWYASRPLPPPRISDIVRITNDPRYSAKRIRGTDGSRIYLRIGVKETGQVPVTGGDITRVPIKGWFHPVSPDGMTFLITTDHDPKDEQFDVWLVGTSGSPARLLTRAWKADANIAWSPDGSQVIYTTPRREIFAISSAGGEPHLLHVMEGPDYPNNLMCSPDGTRIRFNWGPHKLMEMSLDGSNLHEILAGWHPTDFKSSGFWTPDGSLFVFFSAGSFEVGGFPAYQLWAIDERHGWMRKPAAEPVQLTFGPTTWLNPGAFTRDGQKILADGQTWRGELLRYNRQARQLEPFLGGISADMVDFSRDGRFVLYSPFPGGTLLRANRDGTGIQQIISSRTYPVSPRWSPDGSQIAFAEEAHDRPNSVYVVSSQGGAQVRVLPDNKCCNESDPTWSPDGKQLALWVGSPDGKTENELRIVDVSTHKASFLPRPPKRTLSPRWSPDGRYIVCVTNFNSSWENNDGLEIYDFKTSKWKIILTESGSGIWPSWSHDSRWVYYVGSVHGQGEGVTIFRISVNGGQPEKVVNLQAFRGAGHNWMWFGLDPDDNPLMLRDAGTNEIYALTLQR